MVSAAFWAVSKAGLKWLEELRTAVSFTITEKSILIHEHCLLC